jgi:hypothetical protein
MVDTPRVQPAGTQPRDRYREGVRRLRPEVVGKIREVLQAEPSIPRSESARRVGLSRSSLYFYLRRMSEDTREAVARNEALKLRSGQRRWYCDARGNIEGTAPQCTGRCTGSAIGSNENTTYREAKRDANRNTPLGCYCRHIRRICSQR